MNKQNKEIKVPTRLFGIIGYPLGHSVSPILHNWGFYQQALPYSYFAWPVPAKDLGAFVVSLHTLPIWGCSVTIPHKQSIIPYLDKLSDNALSTKAVNTIYWEKGRLCGENTDCLGFIKSLQEMDISPESTLIIGAGGAARACITAFKWIGTTKIFITGRNKEKLYKLQNEHEVDVLSWKEIYEKDIKILVNATPVGMAGGWEDELPCSEEDLSRFRYVFDLIYNPVKTKLLQEAQQKGCITISGLSMFVYQALAQFKVWTGHEFSIGQAKELVKNFLESDK